MAAGLAKSNVACPLRPPVPLIPDPEPVKTPGDGGLGNILPPVHFDCIKPDYEPLGSEYSVMYTINLTHISPWEATVGFFKSAPQPRPPASPGCIVWG
jgi:hypothetical protein